ncbi:MAG: hypothetical protein MUO26_01025 [Methanotrichaceae archaeon]|nr:hypothetical protein [Methanotrichaceae archaeon]
MSARAKHSPLQETQSSRAEHLASALPGVQLASLLSRYSLVLQCVAGAKKKQEEYAKVIKAKSESVKSKLKNIEASLSQTPDLNLFYEYQISGPKMGSGLRVFLILAKGNKINIRTLNIVDSDLWDCGHTQDECHFSVAESHYLANITDNQLSNFLRLYNKKLGAEFEPNWKGTYARPAFLRAASNNFEAELFFEEIDKFGNYYTFYGTIREPSINLEKIKNLKKSDKSVPYLYASIKSKYPELSGEIEAIQEYNFGHRPTVKYIGKLDFEAGKISGKRTAFGTTGKFEMYRI